LSFASPGLFGPGLQLLPCANIAIHLPQIDIVANYVAAWLLEAQQLEDIATYQIRCDETRLSLITRSPPTT